MDPPPASQWPYRAGHQNDATEDDGKPSGDTRARGAGTFLAVLVVATVFVMVVKPQLWAGRRPGGVERGSAGEVNGECDSANAHRCKGR